VKAAGFFRKYRDAILFNRNLILSGAGGFFASAYVSQLYAQYDSSDFANSAAALAVEYAVYIPVFATLFYVDNRKKYVDPATGRRDSRRVWRDIKKLFAAFSVSEVIFSITRVLMQYGLLQAGSQPYEASMASSLVAWGVFFVAINSMAKLVKLFRR
jgi:Na+-driven multidrug efflux pump